MAERGKFEVTSCRESVQFLGHVVSSDGVAADPSKIEKVESWPVLTNRSEVQLFFSRFGELL